MHIIATTTRTGDEVYAWFEVMGMLVERDPKLAKEATMWFLDCTEDQAQEFISDYETV